MYTITEHHTPATLDEALDLLWENPGLKPIAGGTDLLIRLRHSGGEGRFVQVGQLPALQGVTALGDGTLAIGAGCTFTQLATHPLVLARLPILAQAALSMGGPQVRNTATVGGNLCNGAVSADSAATLFALGAQLKLVSRAGARALPIAAFYLGPGRVALKPGEVLQHILVPPRPAGEGGCYLKYSMRNAMDIATLGVAAVCSLGGDGRFATLALGATVVAKTPVRLPSGEAAGLGQKANDETIARIARAALADASPRTSWRAGREFRQHMLAVYCKRAVKQAVERSTP